MAQETAEMSTALHQKVREIVAVELEMQPAELTDTGHFLDDYDADSLTLITVAARIEKELGITVPNSEWNEMTNLTNVFAVLEKYQDAESLHA